MDINKLTADCTVKSQESNLSDDVSKNSIRTGDSKAESCRDSKHSKEILIHNDESRSHRQQVPDNYFTAEKRKNNNLKNSSNKISTSTKSRNKKKKIIKDDTNFMMITSCGQLLFGIVLITFGILVLVHGVSLGTSGAGLWAGMGALIAGALGLVATLAESASSPPPQSPPSSSSGFATAHLATSLVALGLANMSTIAALNAIVRDYARLTSQDSATDILLPASSGDGKGAEGVETNWASLLASFGLLVSSLLELLVAGYTCIRLSPKICGCLARRNTGQTSECQLDIVAVGNEFDPDIGKLKTKNMVHQWVIAQAHSPKNSPPPRRPPFYIVHQPVMTLQPVVQTPYGAVHYPKYPGGYLPAYGPIPMIPPVVSPQMQMYRPRQKRYPSMDHHQLQQQQHLRNDAKERRVSQDSKNEPKRMKSIGEDDNNVDLSLTYTGLDKKISEEFISIAMDPERKSKASSHYGSEIDAKK